MKKSWGFLIFFVILIIIVLMQLLMIFNGYSSIEPDLQYVAEVTGLRGSIQKYAKLIMIDFIDYSLQSQIDNNIKYNVQFQKESLVEGEEQALQDLSDGWIKMKKLADDYEKKRIPKSSKISSWT